MQHNLKRNITLGSEQIEYTVKTSARARLIRLAVYHDGNVVVTCPRYIDESVVENIITHRAGWLLDKIAHFKNNPVSILTENSKRDYAHNKEKARVLVHERLNHWNALYNFTWNDVRIKNTSGRWGSCSKKKNLNFSYKLALLPSELADYIIVHELCHLGELNHSQNFWDLVARAIPNHKILRKQLHGIH